MMPLCTTETSSVMWGWALASLGLPWVAQRVWPMPVEPESGARLQAEFEVAQLAFGAAAPELAVFDRRHASRVVAAVFEPLQRINKLRRHRTGADNANDAAHAPLLRFTLASR